MPNLLNEMEEEIIDVIKANRMDRKNISRVWYHYKKNFANGKAICIYCKCEFSYKSTTANLKCHLKRKHNSQYVKYFPSDKQFESPQSINRENSDVMIPGPSTENTRPNSLRRKFDKLRSYYLKECKKMKNNNHFNQSSFLQDDTFEGSENNSVQSISASDIELDFEVENNEVDLLNIKQESPDNTYKIVNVSSCRDLNASATDEKEKKVESSQDLSFSKELSNVLVKERSTIIPIQQTQSANHQPKSPTQNSEENTDDLYGKFIASKLQEIKDPMQRDLARIEIQNVLIKFKYKVNTFHDSTSRNGLIPIDSI